MHFCQNKVNFFHIFYCMTSASHSNPSATPVLVDSGTFLTETTRSVSVSPRRFATVLGSSKDVDASGAKHSTSTGAEGATKRRSAASIARAAASPALDSQATDSASATKQRPALAFQNRVTNKPRRKKTRILPSQPRADPPSLQKPHLHAKNKKVLEKESCDPCQR
jgi:hypothetical protein